jgi:hypothetical protein
MIEKIRNLLDEIDRSPNEKESWLNDRAREDIINRFPKSYKFDQEKIEGEKFNKLRPVLISKADFVICKLAIDTSNMRPRDIPDVKSVELNKLDVDRIYKKLNEISVENPGQAIKIEGLFKQVRPEFVVTEMGYSYTNENEIVDYIKSRYGVDTDKTTIAQWKEDIDNLIRKPSVIVGVVDYAMGSKIENGNLNLVIKDSHYRIRMEKSNEMDL